MPLLRHPCQGGILAATQRTKHFLTAFCIFNSFAQTPGQPSAERFEVASVRLASDESLHFDGPRVQVLHGSVVMHASTMRACILWAYQMQSAQVIGPDWLDNVRLDMVAKAAGPVGEQHLFSMLRTLLAERLGVKTHVERKEMSVYALIPATGGPKLVQSTTEGPPTLERDRSKGIEAYQRWSMYQLAAEFSMTLGRPVVNETGLTGHFDFRIDTTAVAVDPRNMDRESLLIATMRQLGLKVESRKDWVDVLVIDRAEKVPTEN